MQRFKQPFLSAIIFFGTLWILSIGYSAYTSLSTVESGDPLSKNSWNTMVENLIDHESRIWALYTSITNLDSQVTSLVAGWGSPWKAIGWGIAYTGGNIGIGTTSPGTKLEVAGQIKITGGTPGAGKVLTSDATGLATWQAPSAGSVPQGTHCWLRAVQDSNSCNGADVTYLTNVTCLGNSIATTSCSSQDWWDWFTSGSWTNNCPSGYTLAKISNYSVTCIKN